MTVTTDSQNLKKIEVLFPGFKASEDTDISCVIDRDLKIDYNKLEYFCFHSLSAEGLDLIIVVGSIVFADRKIRRGPAQTWERHLHLKIPVQSDVWFQDSVKQKLEDTLHYLTGDRWEIHFVPAPKGTLLDVSQMYMALEDPAENRIVLPYSDGLDSFAAGQLFSIDEPTSSPVFVTAQSPGVTIQKIYRKKPIRHVFVPISIQGKKTEETFRTRTFLFKTLAALAAYLYGSNRVIIPENGQGTLGPALVPFLHEWPYRGSHPIFTLKLTDFLHAVLGTEIQFEHPYQWQTKGQILTRLEQEGLAEGWQKTYSCVYGVRHSSWQRKRINCGVCSGCQLRRMSLQTAGLDISKDKYLFPRFEIEESSNLFKKSFLNVAKSGALAMQELANFSSQSSAGLRAIHEMSMYTEMDFSHIEYNLSQLLKKHKQEWVAFVEAMGTNSLLKNYGCTL